MRYFEKLPKIVVTQNNVSKVFTNILTKTSVIQSVLNDPLLFYSYDIQDSDTPEIIAHKYYNDMDRFWIILTCNQLMDPQWDWPLTNPILNEYLLNKYTEEHLYDVHHFEKIIKTTDNTSRTTNTEVLVIDEDTYDTLSDSTTTYTLPSGTVTVQITKNIVDNYNYEVSLNESKRNIRILNVSYVSQIEKEFLKLMSS